MTDVGTKTESHPEGRDRAGFNLWLNLILSTLVVLVVGAGAYFGYAIYRDRESNFEASAAGRLVKMLQTQVRKNPNDVVIRVRLAEALSGGGKYSEATSQLNEALKIDPKHVGAYLDLGLVAVAANKAASAEPYFKKVVELTDSDQYKGVDPGRETALYHLGLLALDQKQYADAAGFFKAALVIRKDASDTYYYLAKALQGLGETDGAIQELEIGVQFDPGFAEAHYLLGELYKQKKDDINASYQFVKAAELAPEADPPQQALAAFGPASAWVEKARASLAAGNPTEALNQILVARNLDAKSVEAAKLHAEMLVQAAKLKDALDVYSQAAVLDPKNTEIKAQISALEPQVEALLKAEAAKKKSKK